MWSVRRSTYALHDRWIKVRADSCVTASGHVIEPFYTLEYPDFVHVLAFTADRQVVLTRQYRHGYKGASLELPGGMMDASETSPVATGLRELEEETGYRVARHELLAPHSSEPAKFRNRTHLLLGFEAVADGRRVDDPSEEIELVLVPVAHLVGLIAAGEIVNLAHVGMIMLGLLRLGMISGPA